jgi:hypothetical protein
MFYSFPLLIVCLIFWKCSITLPLSVTANWNEHSADISGISDGDTINYPNPFNPSTTIQFSIPVETVHASSAHITLKVYDVLGREVATLVNETKQPGNYEVKFDGANLPSGVYIYKITANSFIQSRKMLMIK